MPTPPTGTVTFLFTDIEGSTALWEKFPDAMKPALARHDAILRDAIETHRGYVVKTTGDGIHAAFATATDALAAVIAAQRGLEIESWKLDDEISPSSSTRSIRLRIRAALHTGAVEERDGDYYGSPVNRTARLMACGYGGQILISLATQELVRDQLPVGITLRDLGEHRLKDLIRPERIFQVCVFDLPADFPALKTLDYRPNNLPAQATPLIGREKELAAVCQLARRADVRLITLTGPGGTGKTRLGLQVAADVLEQFEHGVYFVNLAPVRDADLVISTIAQTLGVRESGTQSILENLQAHLRDKRLLLVLDNFEQVISAAPIVAELMANSAALKILATSREALHLRGEHEYPVPPLALPDAKHLPSIERMSQYAAVALFIQRACAVKPDFAVTNQNAPAVAEICVRLDGLPLAIELAAARCKLLSPQTILQRLENRLGLLTGGARDLPARHQTLRDTIAWSYDLLDTNEKTLFVRLGVFVGGCTLEAAEAVCGAADFDGIESLAHKSLLRLEEIAPDEFRATMLETIREYSIECLKNTQAADELFLRHAKYYLEWIKRARKELLGTQAAAWLNWIEAERANLRAALAWTIEHDHVEMTVQLNRELWRFWTMRRYFTEGRRWTQAGLDAARKKQLPPELMVIALDGAAGLANDQGDYAEARRLHTECLSIQRGRGSARGIAVSLNNLALVAENQGDYDQAIEFYQESLGLCRQLGEPQLVAIALTNLGNATMFTGDYERAIALQEESVAIRRPLGDKWGVAVSLVNLAEALLYRGDYERAITLCEECVALHRQMDNDINTAFPLATMGRALLMRGDPVQAENLLRTSLALISKTDDKANMVDVLTRIAYAALAQGKSARATRLFGAEDALRLAIGHPLQPIDRAEHSRNLDGARDKLGDAAFVTEFAEGRALTLEQAIAFALENVNA